MSKSRKGARALVQDPPERRWQEALARLRTSLATRDNPPWVGESPDNGDALVVGYDTYPPLLTSIERSELLKWASQVAVDPTVIVPPGRWTIDLTPAALDVGF